MTIRVLTCLAIAIILKDCHPSSQTTNIVTTDIDNFWQAYDNITSTQDSILQYKYLDSLFLSNGSAGLVAIRQARRYTSHDYISAIKNYPKFWSSVRENTLRVNDHREELQRGIEKLKEIYPDLRPAKIYFTIGALRTNGTTLDSLVLIGSELALANEETPTNEFPESLSHLKSYFQSNPSKDIVFLNIHEYVHTQQRATIGSSLLSQTIIEGAAEFLAEIALDQKSPNPQIDFGYENEKRIREEFEKEMFSPNIYNWIMNSPDNQFGIRDLGYFVGYAICKKYYEQTSDKYSAVKRMIELDCNNENELVKFVEESGYFNKPLKTYKSAFEKRRPKVKSVDRVINGQSQIRTDIDVLTIRFSDKMDTRFRNFELGPLGENSVVPITDFRGFSEDSTSVSIGIEKLELLKLYQIVVGSGFRNSEGIPLIPYLIEFETGDE